MSWQNEYKDKIDDIEVKFYEFWEENDIDFSSEIATLKKCERRISKIDKVLKKYNKNISKFNDHYSNVNDEFDDISSEINKIKSTMGYYNNFYLKNFEEKVEQITKKIEKKRADMETDYTMINSAITKLSERRSELDKQFYELYYACMEKKTG